MAKATPPDAGEELETVTAPDGTEIAYERTGSGPPLVLVHCATADHRVWELSDVRATLAEDATVYAIDRRGRGGSGDAEAYEPEREFEDVAAVVESIDEPVTLLGHSAGGFYALEAAMRTDNLNALVLYEPAMPINGYGVGSEAARTEMLSLLEAGETEQAYVVFIEKIAEWTPEEVDAIRSAPMWQEYVDGFPTLIPKYAKIPDYDYDPARFAELTTPTLLLAGSESGQWGKETTEALDDALPNSRVVTFDGHGHAAMLTAPDRFIDEIRTFIRKTN
ncbi:alpha/beta fold hydrolase [Natrialbaceae archaeon GCM10025810]|uniref:alpha/beta fold hydrolase n=1 Tax=Halovalidus salilacus TaxID=3075124 RepID=UPI0036067A5B